MSRTGRPVAGMPPQPANTLNVRSNEYFVPRDGIDREVITADICRYLGNDALVRPGNYENPQTGQVVQGYYITAYRNLTSAMIDDLKADSARWDAERRQQASRNPTNVQYRASTIHQQRQYYGPTEEYDDTTPRYPGTGTAGYTGAAGPGPFAPSTGYGGQSTSAYGTAYQAQPSQYSQTQDVPAYGTAPGYATTSSMTTGYGHQANPEPPYVAPVSFTAAQTAGARDYRSSGSAIPAATMAQSRTAYVTAGPQIPSYPATATTGAYYSQTTDASAQQYPVQPMDPQFGRAPFPNDRYASSSTPTGAEYVTQTTNPVGYTGATRDQQYENSIPRTTAPSSSIKIDSSAATSSRRERSDRNEASEPRRDRERDRDSHRERDRDREQREHREHRHRTR